MVQIRKGVFETNSSSSHSLVVAPKAYNEVYKSMLTNKISEYEIENGVLYLGNYGGLYFGRSPFRILFTLEDKLRYAYANFYNNEKLMQELLKLIQKMNPEVIKISPFSNSYEEKLYQEWVNEGKPEDYRFVELTHVGTDEPYLESWMDAYNFTLGEFLTNPHYVVIVDGDEYNYFSDMWKLGIVKDELYHKKAWE